MPQRHPNDTVAVLHDGASDPTSPRFVPVGLRNAYAQIPADVEARLRREMFRSHDVVRTINGRPVVLQPHDNDDDLETAVVIEKIAEASRIVRREKDRQASTERSKRIHTCRCCGRFDPTATNESMVKSVVVPDCWCASCRAEWTRQETVEHAKRIVDGKTVGEKVAAARADQARVKAS